MGIIFVGLLLMAPQVGLTTVNQLTVIAALYFAIFAMSWDTVSGYTGQFSFGHSFLFAVGGYTSGLLNLGHGVDPAVAIMVAMGLTIVAGFIFGAPALRLSGPYFAVVTFLLPLVLLQIFVLQKDIFGGNLGLGNPDPLVTASGFTASVMLNYYLAVVAFLLVLIVLLAVTRSNAGLVFMAIREDEVTVAASGINPTKFKLFSFGLSAAVAGLGGALYVHSPIGQPQVSQLLAVTVSINVLLASLLGGTGTITGAAGGGIVYYLLNDLIRGIGWVIPILDINIGQFSLVIFSIVVLLLVFFMPDGIFPWVTRRMRGLLGRVRGQAVATDGGEAPLVQIYRRHRRELRELKGEDDE
jgi:branched-chain amino acid transport system permease protein